MVCQINFRIRLTAVSIYDFNVLFVKIDLAGKPGVPEPEDWDVDRVDLKWEAPKDDGGAPIEGYIIEKKEKLTSHWEEAATTTSPQTRGRVTGLKKGSTYQFRVRAINKAGPGEPSEPSKPHVAKARFRESNLYLILNTANLV